MSYQNKRPRKSLRTLLMLWFLLFSVVPLAFITGYSLVKYEQAIDQELLQRLNANQREINVILDEFETTLKEKVKKDASDKSLVFYLTNGKIPQARTLAMQWMRSRFAPHRLSIFNRDGRLEVALYLDENGEVQRHANHESSDVYLSPKFLERAAGADLMTVVEFRNKQSVDLIVFSKVFMPNGHLAGYIEEIIELDHSFLKGIKNRLNIEAVLFSKDEKIVASHEDLEQPILVNKAKGSATALFELDIRSVPYGFMVKPVSWGEEEFYLALGASKQAVKMVLQKVNYAFLWVVGGIIVLLIFLSLIISRILLRPLSDLVSAIQNMRPGEKMTFNKTDNDTELGLLVDAFDDLSTRVQTAQSELKNKIRELESANQEIRDTQAKLVHTAKMASLGQLVAGIAHELNNPIGFIYSNMSHLKDYASRLVHLMDVAEHSPDQLEKEKANLEYDYIIDDMPKLIKSCEDGARRTRDIVLGLRNFSRLEEAKLKEVDIHEGIETTLNLLQGEMKNRIEVTKEFGPLPLITCYPSQLNQVFMNILSNAAQAIEGTGQIHIRTAQRDDNMVEIQIRDTGKGMSPSTVEKIFDPFFTTKSLGKGTGLGLSISYGIIQNHGGDIQVKSEVGKGTEFTITLPIKAPTQ